MSTALLSKRELALIAKERLQGHYGDKLAKVFHLQNDPYDRPYERGVNLTAVLHVEDIEAERETTTALAMAMMNEFDNTYYVSIYPLSIQRYEQQQGRLASVTRKEGVEL